MNQAAARAIERHLGPRVQSWVVGTNPAAYITYTHPKYHMIGRQRYKSTRVCNINLSGLIFIVGVHNESIYLCRSSPHQEKVLYRSCMGYPVRDGADVGPQDIQCPTAIVGASIIWWRESSSHQFMFIPQNPGQKHTHVSTFKVHYSPPIHFRWCSARTWLH